VFTPTATGTATITATSTQNITKSGAASIVVANPPANNEWTWVGGSNLWDSPGSYGTLGVAAPTNQPPARDWSLSWTDNSGNFWLFGGDEYVKNGGGVLNDLWEFNPTTQMWTWISGSSTPGAASVYGKRGVPSINNTPSARAGSIGWIDGGGNLWLFGGGVNDLWKFNPSATTWTWVSGCGPNNVDCFPASNMPAGRTDATSWIDINGNLWMYGGDEGGAGSLDDLWEFNPSTQVWTWISGNNAPDTVGVYGTQGKPSTSNAPGSREGSISWTDSNGNFWLFGGDLVGVNGPIGLLSDLWEFNPATREWTWVSGSSGLGSIGFYGTQGVASASNSPGARDKAVSWIDSSGDLWLFGGTGIDSQGPAGYLNDLWKFDASSKTWTWVNGRSIANAISVYGTQGSPATMNSPGGRYSPVGWKDSNGNLWLFGGFGELVPTGQAFLGDLWRYQP
jgi:hypothetical protein